jgi:hypothetical protein
VLEESQNLVELADLTDQQAKLLVASRRLQLATHMLGLIKSSRYLPKNAL